MRFITFMLVIMVMPSWVYAENKLIQGGFVDLNYYPFLEDINSDTTFTINTGLKLANGFSYFSLTNFWQADGHDKARRWNKFYSEQNLRYTPNASLPLDATVQWNPRSGKDNDRLRLGFRWRLNDTAQLKAFFKQLNLKYSLNFHLYQSDHDSASIWQIEHVYRIDLMPELFKHRLYLAGFGDQFFNTQTGIEWVSEHQLGYKVYKNWHVVTEYRINTFRQSDENNLAAGVEYLIKF